MTDGNNHTYNLKLGKESLIYCINDYNISCKLLKEM